MAKGTVARNARPEAAGITLPDDMVAMAYGLLGAPDDVRDELDRINHHMHRLYEMEPDQAMRVLSAYSSRITEIIRLLFRLEIVDRRYARIRTMDAEKLVVEIDRQHKAHSRILEARAQDLALEGIRR